MPWLAQHPSATEKVRIPDETGPEFILGYWPPLPDIEIRAMLPVLSRPAADPIANPDAFIEQSGMTWALCSKAARWGVRGWSEDGGLPAKTEEVEIDGRRHAVLSDESIEVLRRNGLLVAVALRSIVMNVMTEEKKREFAKQSASLTQSHGTPVADAEQGFRSPKTEASPGGMPTDPGSANAPTK